MASPDVLPSARTTILPKRRAPVTGIATRTRFAKPRPNIGVLSSKANKDSLAKKENEESKDEKASPVPQEDSTTKVSEAPKNTSIADTTATLETTDESISTSREEEIEPTRIEEIPEKTVDEVSLHIEQPTIVPEKEPVEDPPVSTEVVEKTPPRPKSVSEFTPEKETSTTAVNKLADYPTLKSILNSPRKRAPTKKTHERRKRFANGAEAPPRSEMTMIDLIYYNPSGSPMKSLKPTTNVEDLLPPDENEAPIEEEEDENSIVPAAPKVIINENGEIIIDETSLVIRRKDTVSSEAPVVENDNTTYSSFRKKTSKQWTNKETAKFYKALSLVGTDFALMENIFTIDRKVTRTRRELKLKFKREERQNTELVHQAMYETQTYDLSILEDDPDDVVESTETEKEPKKSKKGKSKKKIQSPEEVTVFEEDISTNDTIANENGPEATTYMANEDINTQEELLVSEENIITIGVADFSEIEPKETKEEEVNKGIESQEVEFTSEEAANDEVDVFKIENEPKKTKIGKAKKQVQIQEDQHISEGSTSTNDETGPVALKTKKRTRKKKAEVDIPENPAETSSFLALVPCYDNQAVPVDKGLLSVKPVNNETFYYAHEENADSVQFTNETLPKVAPSKEKSADSDFVYLRNAEIEPEIKDAPARSLRVRKAKVLSDFVTNEMDMSCSDDEDVDSEDETYACKNNKRRRNSIVDNDFVPEEDPKSYSAITINKLHTRLPFKKEKNTYLSSKPHKEVMEPEAPMVSEDLDIVCLPTESEGNIIQPYGKGGNNIFTDAAVSEVVISDVVTRRPKRKAEPNVTRGIKRTVVNPPQNRCPSFSNFTPSEVVSPKYTYSRPHRASPVPQQLPVTIPTECSTGKVPDQYRMPFEPHIDESTMDGPAHTKFDHVAEKFPALKTPPSLPQGLLEGSAPSFNGEPSPMMIFTKSLNNENILHLFVVNNPAENS